jgi:hypothetical protein
MADFYGWMSVEKLKAARNMWPVGWAQKCARPT